jgi:hypothetical protein
MGKFLSHYKIRQFLIIYRKTAYPLFHHDANCYSSMPHGRLVSVTLSMAN